MEKSSVIRLAKPRLWQREIEAATKVLRSGWLVCGETVQQFETRLGQYLAWPHVVCVSSGTAALHLALLAAGIKPGDEVLVPAFTFPATANVVENMGGVPVFIDCQAGDFCLDPSLLEKNIGPRVRAIMPVHAFGIPAEMDAIMAVARKYNIQVIEDAACALGSRYRGRLCGTLGHLAAFSFHPRKLLTTGEGGAVVVPDIVTAEYVKSLRNHGYDDGEYRYAGFNYRLTEFQAAMGITQLEGYDTYLAERRKLAKDYKAALAGVSWVEFPTVPAHRESNIQTFVVKLDPDVDRRWVIDYLASQGIEATIGTYCVPLLHYYRNRYGYRQSDFPFAMDAFNRCLSLPLYHGITPREIEQVAQALKQCPVRSRKVTV